DIWVLPRAGSGKEYPLLQSASDEQSPRFSPDGRSLAYVSDESGIADIYVQSFTADGKLGADRKRVSTNAGGVGPIWRGDGRELFYVAGDGQLVSVAVTRSGPELTFGQPQALFKART